MTKPDLSIIVFTLDETSYARELAPLLIANTVLTIAVAIFDETALAVTRTDFAVSPRTGAWNAAPLVFAALLARRGFGQDHLELGDIHLGAELRCRPIAAVAPDATTAAMSASQESVLALPSLLSSAARPRWASSARRIDSASSSAEGSVS